MNNCMTSLKPGSGLSTRGLKEAHVRPCLAGARPPLQHPALPCPFQKHLSNACASPCSYRQASLVPAVIFSPGSLYQAPPWCPQFHFAHCSFSTEPPKSLSERVNPATSLPSLQLCSHFPRVSEIVIPCDQVGALPGITLCCYVMVAVSVPFVTVCNYLFIYCIS